MLLFNIHTGLLMCRECIFCMSITLEIKYRKSDTVKIYLTKNVEIFKVDICTGWLV